MKQMRSFRLSNTDLDQAANRKSPQHVFKVCNWQIEMSHVFDTSLQSKHAEVLEDRFLKCAKGQYVVLS